MKIRKNDSVKIIQGRDSGKIGKILQVFPSIKKASVEGVNLLTKNLKPRQKGEKGQRIHFPSPIAISNLQLVCPKCGKNTRVGFRKLENDAKARQCKKCKETI